MRKIIPFIITATIVVSCNSSGEKEITVTTTDTLIEKEQLDQKADSASNQIDKLADSAKKMMDKAADKDEKKN